MSQNGPYPGQQWPGGSPEEPYSEPSDPWSGNEAPYSPPYPAAPAAWNAPAPPPPRRGFALGAVVAVLSVLIGGGIATTAWFLLNRKDKTTPAAVATTAPVNGGPRPQTSEDARFATKGQCVRNEGSNIEPELRVVVCAANTFQVLKRIDGRTTGEKDAVGKCAKVEGYTKWYYYDTEYDDVDFVLCLREYGPI